MKNVFSGNPYDAQLASMGAVKPKQAQDPRAMIDGLASKYNVPANVLIALDEASGGKGLNTEQYAKAIAAGVSAGKSVDAIIAEAAGDPARAAALMNRAYDIADEMYPAPAAPANEAGSSIAGDLGRQLGGSIVKGGGGMVEGIGQGVDSAVNAAGSVINPVYQALTGGNIGQTSMGRDAGVAAGDAIRDVGEGIQAGVSEEGRKAMMESTPDGDIFKPSTITLGKNPSLRGYAMLGADVLGSLLPVVATAVITKSPTAAAAVGGTMGGGAGAETARDIVQGMAKDIGPDGKSKLETESALYRELVAGGASPEQALDKVTREAERLAFLFTTPISAFGGAATGAILTKPIKGLAGKGMATRVAGKAGLSGLEEGIQEAAESIATRYGTGQAAQMPIDITEGTFGDFILGALGGGPVGAIAGIPGGQRQPQDEAPPEAGAPPAPLALPAPNNGGTIFGDGPIGAPPRDPTSFERDPNTPSDGSGRGQAAASLSSPVPPPVDGAAAEPLGPIASIAAAAPDLTPIPEVEPVEVPPMFSEMKPGTSVRLQDPDGNLIDAVFQREEEGSAVVRIGGQEVALDPGAFDAAVQGARQADLEAEAKAKGQKVAKPKAPAKPKPGKLSQQAVENVTPPAPEPAMTPEQAAKAAKVIDDKAAKEGWTKGLRKKHDNLVAIAGEAYSPKPASTPDVPDSVAGDSGVAPGETVDPETGEVTQAGAGSGRADPPVVATGGTPDNGVDGAVDAGERGTALAPDADDFDRRMTDTMIAVRAAIRDKKPVTVSGGETRIGGKTITNAEYDQALADVEAEDKVRKNPAPEPRPQSSPITTAPGDRIQPDMLGGADTNETAMAKKERTRKEWGRVLGIAANGSRSDETLEGRDLLIRPTKIIIRAKNGEKSDLDFTIDTEGMDKDAIATAIRGGLQALDRVAPVEDVAPTVPTPAEIKAEADKADKNPTDGQKEAGNYKMGHINWNGLGITIETAKGAMRRGKSATGKEWAVKLPAHYGYIKRTEGADGDHLDVYLGNDPDAKMVFVIDQVDADSRQFDEHKVMIGFSSREAAVNAYGESFSDGRGLDRIGDVSAMTTNQFRNELGKPRWDQPFSKSLSEDVKPAQASKPKDPIPEPPIENAEHDATAQRISDFIGGFPALDRIREQARIYGFENLAFEFRRDAGGGRRDSIWVTGTGKVLSIGQKSKPKPLRDGVIRDTLSSFTNVPASWKPESLFSPPAKTKPGPKSLGTNARGRPLFEDENGVRSYSDNGVTATEAVSLTPTRDRGYVMGVNKSDRGKDFLTQEEWDAKSAAQDLTYKQRARDQGTDDATKGRARKVPGWAVGTPFAADYNAAFDAAKPAPAPAPKPAPTPDPAPDRIGFFLDRIRASMKTFDGSDVPHVKGMGRLGEFLIGVGKKRLQPLEANASVLDIGNNMMAGPEPIVDLIREKLGDDLAALAMKAYDDGVAAAEAASAPAPAAAPPARASNLSPEKQARRDQIRAEMAAAMRNQTNSGLDPKLLLLGTELIMLNIEDGIRGFAENLRNFMDDTGLTAKQVQRVMRASYNDARDEMDMAGEDITGMDSAEQVMAIARKALAAEATAKPSQKPADRGNVEQETPAEEPADDATGSDDIGEVGQDGEPQTGGDGNVAAGQPDGVGTDQPLGAPEAGSSGGNEAIRGGEAPRTRSGRKGRGAGDGTDPAGDAPVRRPRAGAGGLVDAGRARDEPAVPGRANYRITDPEALFAGGPKARFKKNREALETFQRVSDEGRDPTPEEMDAMAAYIGWGSFGQELFQGTFENRYAVKPEWKDEDSWLRDTLGKEAWQSAQNSIINAHYTDPPTVKAIWAAIEAMGFKGGRVLEPSMGIGNFFGLMPQHLEKASQLTGIELDKTTGGMAKMLYPRANVRIMGYEKSTTPDSFYDLVIGNWPFANFSPADRRYNDLNASLHDYFFVKAVDQVRPGGLVVGITSAFSMDGAKNRNVRLHLAKRAELVASFRLPSGAFEKYAGTKVVTDLVIYRKRDAMIMDTTQETWIKSAPFKTPSGDEINVNQYYIDNPGQVLGTLDYGSGTTYFKSGMIVRRPDNIGELLEGIAKRVPADAYRKPEKRGKEPRFVANNTTDRRFSVTVGADGALYQVLGDQMAALEDVVKYRTSNATETKSREDQFRKLVDMRRKIGAVMDADRDGAADADAKRAELKTAYQAFRKAHGAIKDSYAVGVMRTKLKDPFAGLLMAMENVDGTPAAIMDKSTVRAARKLDNPTIRDAFVMSRNESLALDIDRIAELAKTSTDAVTGDLIEAKAIYRVPGGGYQPSDVYLAGNVRQKLVEARDAAAQGEDMAASIAALEAVQPPDIPYFQIEARFGADWLAPDVNRQFVIETLGIEYTNPDDVKLIRSVSGWRVELSDRVARMRGVSDITGAPTPGRKSTGLSLRRFLEATLNTQSISVTEEDGDGGTVKDTKATDQANAKAGELREKFGEWVWKDPERRFEVERNYNEIMNAVATPQIDGSFMEFPGMALTRGTSPFNLRKHQTDAIWKGILNQRGIYGHEVGTGKTITMAGIAVESRRYGLAKKPLLIAHNANSSAVATEAQETYPGAKIMYVDNLSPGEIEAQLGRMRTEDWDMIVIPHSLIDRMSLSEDTLMQMAADDIAAYEAEAIAAAQDEGIELTVEEMDGPSKDLTKKLFSSATAKEMVKARNRLIESIRKQAQRASREGAVAFEDLGIDMILVDESHEFKKPPIATRMAVKGLNKGTSDRSLALRFLTNYVKGQRGGTGVHVFTGTPLTNTLTEIYHQMYYAMDDVMRVNKVDTWDGFFKAFANTISDVEVTSTNEYENVERLAAFINVSELRRMAGQYMDIVFADDMPEFKPRTTASGKDMNSKDLTDKERAELLDGRNDDPQGRPYKKVVHDIGPMGTDQKRILQQSVRYARDFKAAGGKARREIMQNGGPDAPIVFNAVPNRASMDPRLHEIDAEDDPNSKANRAVKNIARIYNDEPMATQVLFMDEGYSDASVSVKTNKETGEKTKTKKAKFNLVADIVAKLVKEGVKRDEIFIVAGGVKPDEKRIIADKMNKREIRVVIGQTRTLGVGVNMQKYLRAMHHLDAPWMPGDLEQRNGRGQRQGNTWNTVYEYRYLTESLDGRRWQVLAIKDRFIKAFLKAKEGLRTIEGDAADDSESMDSSSLGDTLAEAAGDPRLMQSNKLAKRIEKLQSRERIHSQGIADAISKAKRLRSIAEREEAELPPRRADAGHVRALREAATFSATVNGKTYDNRPEAEAAIEAYLPKAGLQIRRGTTETLSVEVNGFKVEGEVKQYASMGNTDFRITRQGVYNIGKPSLSSIEGAIRRIPDRLADAEATIEDTRKQAERLDAMAKEPFQQQKDLDQKKADLEKLKQDMQDNPVPAPVWLRQGAPIDTLIYVDGKERVVTGHRWTETGWFVATEQGDVDYADAKDQFGMALYDVVPFEAPEVLEGSKAIMGDESDGDGAEMRDFAPGDPDAPITDDDMRSITRDMNAELAASGLAGKVSVRVVRRLISHVTGNQIQGRFNEGARNIEVRGGAAAGERGVMRHEIIHALRSEALWGKPYGLFSQAEWRELARAAQAEPGIVASVKENYPNLDRPAQVEEMVAELYRLWADQRDGYDRVAKALAKVEAFLQAMANLLRGKGFVSAARTMEQIAGGTVGGRGPQGPGGARRGRDDAAQDGAEMRALPGTVRDKFKGLVGFRNWRDPKEVLRNLTTDAMTGDKMSVLALVPGRALFAEMGSKLLSTKRYIRAKEEMDTLRNDWHAKAADVAQKWIDMQKKNPAANEALMDLMHLSTMTGVDPSKADTWGKDDQFLRNAKMEVSRNGDKAPDWAKQKLADQASRQKSYAAIKALYDAMPPEYQAFYVEVKDSYEQMADDYDKALEENITLGAKIALKRAEKEHRKTLRQIEDDGLTGDDKATAIEEAEATLAKVRARANSGAASQIKAMRKIFEGQRLKGPYFPLARFGDYFVTVRDENGKVINFSRFESESRQQVFKTEQEALHPGRVSFGLMSKKGDMRDQVDPKFVSDVEMLLADSGASAEVMDAIWQRYLETMPDQSIRTSKIHRKGREGFNRDALRSYTSHTFHGAHQLARLKYGLELQDALDDAQDEARRADDPNRATALVNEMRKRMDWTMNPTGSSWSAAASSLAFVWYLGVSPAAAIVNLTQTTVIGPSVFVAGIKSATYPKALAALGRAAKDFGKGQGVSWKDTWTAENAPGLTDDERAAMKEGYRRGTIDKTQAHDLAAVAESGVEFSPFREKWMRRIGFAFHHAERVNREVTFLAAYRLARADGLNHADAIDKAADLTWKTHFSYQNSDRPRFMQQDIPKVIFIFRQFSVNLLYRLFRDAHQSLAGATKAERKEARTQLVGISLSMMAHAGIKGVWGYSLLMMLLSAFLPGDDDDIEEWMQDALLMEGDSLGVAAANYAVGAFLNGVPGQLTGAALTERIGSPNLWFRGSDRNLEGEDVVQHYINELAGPIGGIAYSIFGRGLPSLAEGEVVRGVEALTPKFVRDVVRTGRFATEGATTRNGDVLIEDVSPRELFLQANGFTPARLAERYEQNTRLKNKEKEITDQRKDLHKAASDAIKAGEPIPEKVMDRIRAFNSEFPEYPITAKTIKQSYMGRMRASERNEFGVALNPRLNDRLRGDLSPALYN